MLVKVLYTRKLKTGQNVAHVQIGEMFGDVLATDDITGAGEYDLKSTLRQQDGRIVALIRIEKP